MAVHAAFLDRDKRRPQSGAATNAAEEKRAENAAPTVKKRKCTAKPPLGEGIKRSNRSSTPAPAFTITERTATFAGQDNSSKGLFARGKIPANNTLFTERLVMCANMRQMTAYQDQNDGMPECTLQISNQSWGKLLYDSALLYFCNHGLSTPHEGAANCQFSADFDSGRTSNAKVTSCADSSIQLTTTAPLDDGDEVLWCYDDRYPFRFDWFNTVDDRLAHLLGCATAEFAKEHVSGANTQPARCLLICMAAQANTGAPLLPIPVAQGPPVVKSNRAGVSELQQLVRRRDTWMINAPAGTDIVDESTALTMCAVSSDGNCLFYAIIACLLAIKLDKCTAEDPFAPASEPTLTYGPLHRSTSSGTLLATQRRRSEACVGPTVVDNDSRLPLKPDFAAVLRRAVCASVRESVPSKNAWAKFAAWKECAPFLKMKANNAEFKTYEDSAVGNSDDLFQRWTECLATDCHYSDSKLILETELAGSLNCTIHILTATKEYCENHSRANDGNDYTCDRCKMNTHVTAISNGVWECVACTTKNSANETCCQVCRCPPELESVGCKTIAELCQLQQWVCATCTETNNPLQSACSWCHGKRGDYHWFYNSTANDKGTKMIAWSGAELICDGSDAVHLLQDITGKTVTTLDECGTRRVLCTDMVRLRPPPAIVRLVNYREHYYPVVADTTLSWVLKWESGNYVPRIVSHGLGGEDGDDGEDGEDGEDAASDNRPAAPAPFTPRTPRKRKSSRLEELQAKKRARTNEVRTGGSSS